MNNLITRIASAIYVAIGQEANTTVSARRNVRGILSVHRKPE